MSTPRVTYVCRSCGSKNVGWDAFTYWDEERQEMVLLGIYDATHCHACEDEENVKEVPLEEARAAIAKAEGRS